MFISRAKIQSLLKPISRFVFLRLYSTSSPPKSLMSQITEAFRQENVKLIDPQILAQVQPCHVGTVLHSLANKPNSAVEFFKWCEVVLGFNHTLESYVNFLCLLLSRRNFDDGRFVFGEMIEKFQFIDFGVVLGDELFMIYGLNKSTMYSFILDSYCGLGFIDRSIELFDIMCGKRIVVSKYALLKFLDSLVDLGRVSVIVDVIGKSQNALMRGHAQDFDIYSFSMNGFMKKGEMEMVLEFHSKMMERGFPVDIVSCNKFLSRLCKVNCVNYAHKLFLLLLEVGPIPSVVTFSTLIKTCCEEGKMGYAFELYNLMVERGRP
ncbi:pentatricopeptide repeat-containing protein [Dorcoceras hygrometricum]|uniref:Pentatricopeptide repeat-containing protein n=1 Tax=Dorcoceras hygrometricum TaxID=472368 RepID=A0A2Z7DBT1_9LAMI|nr:pentatricopeptide repeat-containing protein [Dorcoceras hygrometricum]